VVVHAPRSGSHPSDAHVRGTVESALGAARSARQVVALAAALARIEARAALGHALFGVALSLTGITIGALALLLLLAAGVAGLSIVLSPWLALLIVGGAAALASVMLLLIGVLTLRRLAVVAPRHAGQELRRTLDELRAALSSESQSP
jgi:hypothetical protein